MASSTKTIKTYRHEFSKEFMAELSRFSKVHQYDDRHTYKSEWQKWINQETIAQAMDFEKRRLQENGYIGDIDDKMFKAGRYYFRKKTTNNTDEHVTPKAEQELSPQPTSPITSGQDLPTTPVTTRRTYITMSKQCIRMMDNHISAAATAITTTTTTTTTTTADMSQFKPSTCYNHFYETQMTTPEMTKEIENIIEKYEKTHFILFYFADGFFGGAGFRSK